MKLDARQAAIILWLSAMTLVIGSVASKALEGGLPRSAQMPSTPFALRRAIGARSELGGLPKSLFKPLSKSFLKSLLKSAPSPKFDAAWLRQISAQGSVVAAATSGPTVSKVISAINDAAVASGEKPRVHAGDTITYTITYGNTSTSTLSSLLLRDPLPSISAPDQTTTKTTFVSASDGGALATNPFTQEPTTNVEWAGLADLPGNTSRTVTLKVGIPQDTANDSSVANFFYVLMGTLNGNSVQSDPGTTVGFQVGTPTLAINKTLLKINGTAYQTGGSTAVAPGDTITYLLSMSNSGDGSSYSATIGDTLPANTTFQSESFADSSGNATATPNGGSIANSSASIRLFSLSQLKPNQTAYVIITVKVNTTAQNGATVSNAPYNGTKGYYLNGNDPNGNLVIAPTNGATITNTVTTSTPTSTLHVKTLTKTAVTTGNNPTTIATIQSGSNFVFRISYDITNTSGTTDVGPVSIKDLVPTGAQYVSGGDSTSTDMGTGRTQVVFNLGTISHNQEAIGTYSFTVKATANSGATITNAKTDYFVSEPGGTTNGTTDAAVSVTGSSTAPAPKLFISNTTSSPAKSPDKSTAAPGDNITYTFTYGNNSGGGAASAQTYATDVIPTGTTFVAAHYVNSTNGVIGAYDNNITKPSVGSTGTVSYQIGALTAGQTSGIYLQLVVKVNTSSPPASVVNKATITDPTNSVSADSDQATTTISTGGLPRLAISKSADKTAASVGQNISYTMTYGNSAGGGASTSQAIVTDAVPTGTTFVAAHFVDGNGSVISLYDNNITRPRVGSSGNVVYQVGVLSPGQTSGIFLQLIVKVNAANLPSSVSNQATISDPGASGAASANSNVVTTNIVAASKLTLAKTADKMSTNRKTVKPGETITYTLNFGNTGGSATSANTYASDETPAHTTFVAAHFVNKNGATYGTYESNIDRPDVGDTGNVVFHVGALRAGQTSASSNIYLQIIVKVDADLLTPGTSISNVGHIVDLSNGGVNAPITDSNQVDTVVNIIAPDFALVKNADVSRVGPGGVITYTMQFANDKSAGKSSDNTFVYDAIPANTSLVEAHFVDKNGNIYNSYDQSSLTVANDNSAVTYKLGVLQPDQSSKNTNIYLQLRVRVNSNVTKNQATSISNTASLLDYAFSQYPEGNVSSNAVSTSIDYPVVKPAQLFIDMTAPILTNDTVTYEINYGNAGDVAASHVVVRNRIDISKVTLEPDALSDGGTLVIPGSIQDSTRYAYWQIGDVPPHSAGHVTLTVHAKKNKSIQYIDADSFDILIPGEYLPGGKRGQSQIFDRAFPARITVNGGAILAKLHAARVQMVADTSGGRVSAQGFNLLDALTTAFQRLVGYFNTPRPTRQQQAIKKVTDSLTPQSTLISVGHRLDYVEFKNGVTYTPRGGGQVEVIGPANLIDCQQGVKIVAAGGGNIVAQGGGNIVAQGGGNLISIKLIGQDGNSIVAQGGGNLSSILASAIPASIVAQGGGNIVAQGGGNIVAQGGGNLISQDGNGVISNDGGTLLGKVAASIVAQGGGNFVPLGAVPLLGGGATSLISNDGGSLVNTNGSNLIGQDGNGLIGQDGNGLIGQDGNGIVAQGGGNLIVRSGG